ncbi:hypothetical protein U1Q18_025309 [Sarracenia purpurea var. burkii]
MALREEMSRGGGSTGMTSSSSPVATELDAVNVTLPLFEGQRSPAKLIKEGKVGETMNHPGFSPSPTGSSSPAKISQVFSEALRQDREDAEGDDDSQEEGEIDLLDLKRRNLVCDKALAQTRGGAKDVNSPAQRVTDSEEESEEDREVDEEELLYRQALIDKAMVEQRLVLALDVSFRI